MPYKLVLSCNIVQEKSLRNLIVAYAVFGRVSLLLISYLSLCGREWGAGGRLLTLLPLGWALIQGGR